MKKQLLYASGTLISLLCVYHFNSWRKRIVFKEQVVQSRRRAEELFAAERLKDQRLLEEGHLWLGDLELENSNPRASASQGSQPPVAPESISHSERISGTISKPDSSLTARYEVHRCQTGSPVCSSGGTVSIESGDRLIATMSLSLLQPDVLGVLRSTFRVDWKDTSLTHREKVVIFQELANASDSAAPTTLESLLSTAYRDIAAESLQRSVQQTDSHNDLFRFILLRILDVVAADSV